MLCFLVLIHGLCQCLPEATTCLRLPHHSPARWCQHWEVWETPWMAAGGHNSPTVEKRECCTQR